MKKIFLCFTLLSVVLNVTGQELKIKRVAIQPSDLSAIKNPCLDLNGDTCSLIKIQAKNLEGLQFSNPNQYVQCSYSNGIYYVYVPSLSRKLDLIHKDYMPIQLDMANYGYNRLKRGKTYLVVLEVPQVKDLKSSVILKVEPNNASVIFDENDYAANGSGMFEFPVSEGKHSYMVHAENYSSHNATISVGKSEVKTIVIRLQPIMHEILVDCNVDKARVYVDNVDYGRVGKIMLPQGEHKIRVQSDGFLDSEKDIMITSSTEDLSFILKENTKVTHIHATPVTIYASNSTKIFKNGKKIKGWKNGATIMFMPGEYLLTTNSGGEKKIIVDSTPFDVHFSEGQSSSSVQPQNDSNHSNYRNADRIINSINNTSRWNYLRRSRKW